MSHCAVETLQSNLVRPELIVLVALQCASSTRCMWESASSVLVFMTQTASLQTHQHIKKLRVFVVTTERKRFSNCQQTVWKMEWEGTLTASGVVVKYEVFDTYSDETAALQHHYSCSVNRGSDYSTAKGPSIRVYEIKPAWAHCCPVDVDTI